MAPKIAAKKSAAKKLTKAAPQPVAEPTCVMPKKDLDKMYSAMKYMASKGNPSPLRSYLTLSTKDDKRAFCAKYLNDKKFEWLTVTETHTAGEDNSLSSEEGWMTRFQIADLEKLPIDSELLKNRIAELPSREHSSNAYKDGGELEYFWTSNVKRRRTQTDHRAISASSSVDVKASVGQTIIDGFRVSMIDGQPAQKALEDGVKEEPSEINKKQLALSIKKLVKSMQDSTLESLVLKNKLTEAAKAKPYLLPIVNELEKQHVVFTSARDMILETQAALPTMSADDMEKAAGTLKTCSVHYEAFRNGALKEGSNLMK